MGSLGQAINPCPCAPIGKGRGRLVIKPAQDELSAGVIASLDID